MKAFVWDQRFETGIESVDNQHRQLVEIVNQLGDQLVFGSDPDAEKLQALFHQLAQYAHRHFADEERLMAESGVDGRHLQLHAQHHRQFIEQVLGMWNARASLAHPAETVHGFLASWLTVHILGEDQAMARQIAAIAGGQSAVQAFAREAQAEDAGTNVLLDALERLYGLLSEQNRNLAEANRSLEEKIEQRTSELRAANERLEREQIELTQLLQKVEEAQQQLLQSEKMAAIGQLAAGVAHEINNPIGFVNSNLGTLKTYIERLMNLVDAYEAVDGGAGAEVIAKARREADLDFLRDDLPSLVRESHEGLSRVTRIVQDLKDFSRVDQAAVQQADLNAGLESTLNVVWNELKYKADVVRELGDIPLVSCVPAQINQVFMNLLVNAAQAIERHGTIFVRSGCENAYVWFEIQDTGRGMTEEVRKHIFEPFYTTKQVGQGTGLGLSISYDIIVKRHGGWIDVASEPGVGTTFRFGLPLK